MSDFFNLSYLMRVKLPEKNSAQVDLDSLPLSGNMVREVANKGQVQYEFAVMQLLGVLSFLIQDLVDVKAPDGREHVASLYLMSVNASGERKTTGKAPFEKAMLECLESIEAEHCKKMEIYNAKKNLVERAIKKIQHNNAKALIVANEQYGEDSLVRTLDNHYGEIEKLMEALPEFPNTHAMLSLADTTPAGMAKHILDMKAKSVQVSTTEADEFLSNGFSKSAALLNRAWGGEGVNRIRASQKGGMQECRLTLNFSMQEAVAEKAFLEKNKLTTTGTRARCLWFVGEPLAGQRRQNKDSSLDRGVTEPYDARVRELMDLNVQLSAKGRSSRHKIEFDESAAQFWLIIADEIERNCSSQGRFGEHTDFGSKLAENILRVAVLLHVFNEGFDERVSINELKVAMNICCYSADQYVNVFSENSEEENDLRKFFNYIQKKRDEGVRYIIKSDVLVYGPFRKNGANRLNAVLAKMITYNEVYIISHDCFTRSGRKTKPMKIIDLYPGNAHNHFEYQRLIANVSNVTL